MHSWAQKSLYIGVQQAFIYYLAREGVAASGKYLSPHKDKSIAYKKSLCEYDFIVCTASTQRRDPEL
jgi:hypothetical protein